MIDKILLNKYVLLYLFLLIFFAVLLFLVRKLYSKFIGRKRKKQGLSSKILVGPESQLKVLRHSAIMESAVFVFWILFIPFVIIKLPGVDENARNGILATFIALFVWVTFNASNILKAIVGGFFFRILVAFSRPLQLHDRVTIKGQSGKIVDIGIFYVRLKTPDDDLISIPTYSLWSETLVSANAGDRSSLCVMNYYISSLTSPEKRKKAEDIIWDAIQASIYYDPGKTMQIYCSQTSESIVLTAKAYVASTYREPDFKSDVTNQVLDEFSKNTILLAPSILHSKVAMASNIPE